MILNDSKFLMIRQILSYIATSMRMFQRQLQRVGISKDPRGKRVIVTCIEENKSVGIFRVNFRHLP